MYTCFKKMLLENYLKLIKSWKCHKLPKFSPLLMFRWLHHRLVRKFQPGVLDNWLLIHSFLCQALEHEIAIYQNLMKELNESAQTLSLVGSIQYVEVDAPKEQVHSRLQELQELAAARYKLKLPLGSWVWFKVHWSQLPHCNLDPLSPLFSAVFGKFDSFCVRIMCIYELSIVAKQKFYISFKEFCCMLRIWSPQIFSLPLIVLL